MGPSNVTYWAWPARFQRYGLPRPGSVSTSHGGGSERMSFRLGMTWGHNIGQEVGTCAAQVFQAAFLVVTEGPKPLRVGVHPYCEAFQGAGVELDLVMACGSGQEREERAGRGGAFARFGEALAIAVLDLIEEARFAVAHEGVVGLGGGEIELGGPGILRARGVAGDALLVENGLYQTIKPQGPGAFRAGRNPGRLGTRGEDRSGGCGLGSRFVAANAADGLARLCVSGAAHGLDGEALRVEGLEEQGDARGHTKPGRAIGFDGHGAEDAFAGVIRREAHNGEIHGRMGDRKRAAQG